MPLSLLPQWCRMSPRSGARRFRRDTSAKPQTGVAPRPLLAVEGALLHHESPIASVLLPDHNTPLVIPLVIRE